MELRIILVIVVVVELLEDIILIEVCFEDDY